ncbi:signal peptidase I [Enterococcus sp. DIV0724b]
MKLQSKKRQRHEQQVKNDERKNRKRKKQCRQVVIKKKVKEKSKNVQEKAKKKKAPEVALTHKPRKKKKAVKKKIKAVKKSSKQAYWEKVKMLLLEMMLAIISTATILLFFFNFFYAILKVEGYAMIPTIHGGDWVFVDKKKKIRSFDLIYFEMPNSKEKYIRRVIAMPGETVVYRDDTLIINGEIKDETFIGEQIAESKELKTTFTEDFTATTLTGHGEIPKEKFLVLGDNRSYATDSRYFGLVDKKDIIGVVTTRIWPMYKIENLDYRMIN